MKRSSVRLSVRPVCMSRRSTAAAACSGFAAERPAGGRYRERIMGFLTTMRYTNPSTHSQKAPALSSNGAATRRSSANAGSVMLMAEE